MTLQQHTLHISLPNKCITQMGWADKLLPLAHTMDTSVAHTLLLASGWLAVATSVTHSEEVVVVQMVIDRRRMGGRCNLLKAPSTRWDGVIITRERLYRPHYNNGKNIATTSPFPVNDVHPIPSLPFTSLSPPLLHSLPFHITIPFRPIPLPSISLPLPTVCC